MKAIEASGTSVGVRTADGGVLLACEKLLPSVRVLPSDMRIKP